MKRPRIINSTRWRTADLRALAHGVKNRFGEIESYRVDEITFRSAAKSLSTEETLSPYTFIRHPPGVRNPGYRLIMFLPADEISAVEVANVLFKGYWILTEETYRKNNDITADFLILRKVRWAAAFRVRDKWMKKKPYLSKQ